jgi:hypothetical protein
MIYHQLVEQHWPAFRTMLDMQGRHLPGHVSREFEVYVKGGSSMLLYTAIQSPHLGTRPRLIVVMH